MSKPNAKLRITFDFEVKLPDTVLHDDHEAFHKAVQALLGSMVFQGMPTVTGKQLAKEGGRLCTHSYRLDVTNLRVPSLPREHLVMAAPHLTDEELERLERQISGKVVSDDHAELSRVIRRHALALVNEYRTIPCLVTALLTSGAPAQLEGKLNLTNGNVLLNEQDRHARLRGNQENIRVIAAGGEVSLPATCAGHTLSGPVIEVQIKEIGLFRGALMEAWQKQ